MPSKLKKAIGAVKDQTSISLAKVSNNNSSNLEVAVLKTTTHDSVPIEERYVFEILQLISSNKIYAAACARAIGKRIGRTRNWIVALKSLMLVLRIFQDGDPYFPREVLHAMKRGAKILNLSNFRDDSNSSPWDYTAFVRTFALYLDERLDCFLTGKLQRRFTHKERDGHHHHSNRSNRRANEPVRGMKPNMLLDKILYWQRLLERAIATRPTGQAKANRLVQISLYAVVQESFDLYKDISDGLTLLLDSFFHLQYQSCVSAFHICVKAAKQFEELSAFYALCKTIGVGRTSEYPCVQTISEELIETLQEFLKDQSSFSANTRTPSRPLLLAAPDGSTPGRQDSYGGRSGYSSCEALSEFSEMSERTSEFGSQQCTTSLEDLISASETGRSPSISIDLEAYSDQFEKKSDQKDEPFRVSDTGSTQSLPVSTSLVDLVSLEDWPEDDQQNKEAESQEQERKEEPLELSSGWELVLANTVTQPSAQSLPNSDGFDPFTKLEQSFPNSNSFDPCPKQEQSFPNSNIFDPFSKQEQSMPIFNTFDHFPIQEHEQSLPNFSNFDPFPQQDQEQSLHDKLDTFDAFTSQKQEQNEQETGAGWELVLFETVTQPTQQTDITTNTMYTSSLDSLYNQAPLQSQHYNPAALQSQHYNPFLQDFSEITATEATSAPTINGGFEEVFPAMDAFSTEPTFQITLPTFQSSLPAPTFEASQPTFQASPTFQANQPMFHSEPATFQASAQMIESTPTFSAQTSQSSNFPAQTPVQLSQSTKVDVQNETDPFASPFSDQQTYNGPLNQQNLLQEQQLWLQQQYKIIAKHLA